MDESATPDPYCVVSVVPLPGAEHLPSYKKQKLKTDTVDDDLSPEWKTKMEFDMFASTSKILIQVYDSNGVPDREMGYAELTVGTGGIPGPALCSDTHLTDGKTEVQLSKIQQTVNVQVRKPTTHLYQCVSRSAWKPTTQALSSKYTY